MLDTTMNTLNEITDTVEEIVANLPVKTAKFREENSPWHIDNQNVLIAAIETNAHFFYVFYRLGLQAHGGEIGVCYVNPSTDRIETFAQFHDQGIGPKLHHLFRNLTCCEYCAKMVIRE